MSPTRAVYVPWDLALREQAKLLADLAEFTNINTLILLDAHTSARDGTYSASRLVLPSREAFGTKASVVTRPEFDAMAEFMRLAGSKGFKVLCLVAPLFVSEGSDSDACVDVTGQRVPGAGGALRYGCPNNPEVAEYGATLLREFIDSWPTMDLLSIDHIEYPINLFAYWPDVELRYLFVCFCGHCYEKAGREGFDLAEAQSELRSFFDSLGAGAASPGPGRSDPMDIRAVDVINFFLKRPSVARWLDFRMRSMTDYTLRVLRSSRASAKKSNPKLKLGFYFQLPSLSNLVGTDFRALSAHFDYASPKFPDYVPGSIIPIVAERIASAKGRIDARALRAALRGLIDLGPEPGDSRPLGELKNALLFSNAFEPSMVEGQMRHLRPLLGKVDLLPHIWGHTGDPDDLREKRAALEREGFQGYALWAFGDSLSGKRIRASKGTL